MSFFSRIKKDHTALPKYPCFYIKSNTYPKRELNSDEIIFFNEFEAELKNAKIDPFSITLTQLGGGTFNVDTPFCYVGKIGLNPITTSDKYAVMKNGAKRASRVFESKKDAQSYLLQKGGDSIVFRPGNAGKFYMQYSIGLYNTKEFYTTSLQECIDHIPYWIKYIKYCKHC